MAVTQTVQTRLLPIDVLGKQLVYQMPGGRVSWRVERWGSGFLQLRPLEPTRQARLDRVEWMAWRGYIEAGLVRVES